MYIINLRIQFYKFALKAIFSEKSRENTLLYFTHISISNVSWLPVSFVCISRQAKNLL